MKVPLPSVNETSQRSAISSVLSQASGKSRHSSRISAGGLDVVAVAGEREPLARAVAGRDVHRRAGVDAEQVLLRGRVLAHDVVGVVGGEQRDAAGPWRAAAARRAPGSRCRGRGPSARGSSSPGRGCPGSSAAALRAASYWPWRRWTCTSPDGQPVVPMMPLPCWASSSRSMRGCLKKPSRQAPVLSRNRLCMPSVDSESSVMCV